MKLLDLEALAGKAGNPDYFSGTVVLKRADEPFDPVDLMRVEFAAGARTSWHTHSGVQLLQVVSGRCRYQHEGGKVEEAGVGSTIYIPPGEKHWHGATPDAPMAHLAINIALETDWLEAVTDEQYQG